MYRDPTLDEKPALLANRGGAFYSEAAAQLIASLHDGAGDVQVVNVRNDGAIDGLPAGRGRRDPGADRSRRRPSRLRSRRSTRTCSGSSRPSRPTSGWRSRRPGPATASLALRALAANPLVGGLGVAQPLLDALLEANVAHLPQFRSAAVG